MNIIKISALSVFLTLSLGAASTLAVAEETAATSTNESVAEAIAHIEKGLAEVNKSDLSAANLHLKAARAASEKITGHDAAVKEANDHVVKGQIFSKKGDVTKSAEELNKAIALYKSL